LTAQPLHGAQVVGQPAAVPASPNSANRASSPGTGQAQTVGLDNRVVRLLFQWPDELDRYHLFHATRAELLRALGRSVQARRAEERALGLTANSAERALLEQRLT
jgi:predicted RNA polymerase sigma factor